jgi:hypothetical protein
VSAPASVSICSLSLTVTYRCLCISFFLLCASALECLC